MSNVISFNGKPYILESELAGKIEKLVHEYDGKISSVAVVGVLELIKTDILNQVINGD